MLSESHLRSIFRIIFQCTCVAEEPYRNNNNDNNDNNNNNNNNNHNNNSNNNNDDNNAVEKDVQWSFKPPDDVMILLKKFSGSVNISLRRISIIGYVAYLSELRAFCYSFKIKDTGRMSGSDRADEGDVDVAGAREVRGDSNAVDDDENNNQDQNKEESGGLEEEGIKVLNMMVSSVTDDTAGLVFLVSGDGGVSGEGGGGEGGGERDREERDEGKIEKKEKKIDKKDEKEKKEKL